MTLLFSEEKIAAFLKKCQSLKDRQILLESFEEYTKRKIKENEESPERSDGYNGGRRFDKKGKDNK